MKKIILLIILGAFQYSGYCQEGTLVPAIYSLAANKVSIFDQSLCRHDSFCPLEYEFGLDYFLDLTFTPNGKLYIIGQSKVAEVDTATGELTILCEVPFANHPSLIDLNDSVLLTDAKDTLWAINLNTCSYTPLGTIGYGPYYSQSDGDLVWINRKLYTAAQGRLFRITLNATNTAIESSILVNEASTDIPPSYGLAVIVVSADDSYPQESILSIGYSPYSYIINPVTGTFDSFCYYTDFSAGSIAGLTNGYRFIADTIISDSSSDSSSALNEMNVKQSIEIFPNPSMDGKISVVLKNIDLNNTSISLHDIYGKRVYFNSHIIGPNQIMLELPPSYSPGIYIIEIFTGKGKLRQKINLI